MYETILASIVGSLPFILIWLYSWTHPPRWVKELGDQMGENIQSLRTWVPRLMGALRGTPESVKEYREQAAEQTGLIGLLTTIAPLLNQLPQLIELADKAGLIDAITKGAGESATGGAKVGW